MKQALYVTATVLCILFLPTQIQSVTAHPFVPDGQLFTIDNESSDAPFVVTVEGANQEFTDVGIADVGQYSGTIDYTATAVEIAGHVVAYPVTADVPLPSGVKIKVTWQNPNAVRVDNEITQN